MESVLVSCRDFEDALVEAQLFYWTFGRHVTPAIGRLLRLLGSPEGRPMTQETFTVLPIMLWYRRVGKRCVKGTAYLSFSRLNVSGLRVCMTLDFGAMILRQAVRRHTSTLSPPPSIPLRMSTAPAPSPTRAYQGSSAGYDLVLEQDLDMEPLEMLRISLRRPTGCPNAIYYPRSSAQKKGLHVARLIQDSPQSEVVVLELIYVAWGEGLRFQARAGDRVVQMLILPGSPRTPAFFHVQPIEGNPGIMSHILPASISTYSLSSYLPTPPGRPRVRLSTHAPHIRLTSLDPVALGIEEDQKGAGEGRRIVRSAYDGDPERRGMFFDVPLPPFRLGPYETKLLPTGLRSELQAGQALLLSSSVQLNDLGLMVAGVVDASYKGELFVMVTNTHSHEVVSGETGSRVVAWGVVTRVLAARGDVGEARGSGGFGSSGR